jgi:protein TonB
MQRRRQQAMLMAAAAALHLLLLAAMPPVAAGMHKRACPLRIQLALAQPEDAAAPLVIPAQHAVPVAAPLPQPKRQQRTAPDLLPSRPSPTQPAAAAPPAVAPASEPAGAPAPADTGRIVGAGDFANGPSFHSGGGTSQPGSVPDKPARPDGVPGGTGPGPAPAAPSVPAIDTDQLLRDYSAGLISRIKGQQRYPASAQADGVEGKVKVSFTVDASGVLVSASVSSSSGSDELDSAALAAVNRAAPFAPIPAELNRSSAKLSVTLKFYLK